MGRLRKSSPKRMNADVNDTLLAYPFNNSDVADPAPVRPRKKPQPQEGMLQVASRNSDHASVSQQHQDITDDKYKDLRRPRQLLFFRNGDRYFRGKRLRITPNRFQTFDNLLSELTKHMSLPYGVRKIYHPESGKSITNIENLIDGESYVCASFEKFKKVKYGDSHSTPDWSTGPKSNHSQLQSDLYGRFSYSYPSTGKYAAAYARSPAGGPESLKKGGSGPVSLSFPGIKRPALSHREPVSKSTGALHFDLGPAKPKLCKIVKAGSTPRQSVSLLLNKRSILSFEALVQDVSDAFGLSKFKNHRIKKLFTIEGSEVKGVGDFFRNPDDVFIASASRRHLTEDEIAEIFSENFPNIPYAKGKRRRIKERNSKSEGSVEDDDGGESLTVVQAKKDRRKSKKAEDAAVASEARKPKEDSEEGHHQEEDLRLKEEKKKRREETAREEANRKKEEELRRKEEELKKREEELKKKFLDDKKKKTEKERLAAIAKKEAELKAKEEELQRKEDEKRKQEEQEEQERMRLEEEEEEKQQLAEFEDDLQTPNDGMELFDSQDLDPFGDENDNHQLHSPEDLDDSASTKSNLDFTSDPREIVSKDSILQRYAIGQKIGDGNFADVHEATLKETEEVFALKIVDKAKLQGKEHMIENEIGIMKNINHRNIVKLFEEHETRDHIYLVMELIQGGDLFDAITESVKFTEADAAVIISDMASALAYLHSLNIVHRDLKPENLLFVNRQVSKSSGDITLKLADFGLAMEVKEPIFTVCGTPTYVAPEILAETGYGLEVDMWATGVICYILLCGFPPFRSLDRDQEELFELIQSGEFVYLSPYWDNISDDAKDLIDHLLVVSRRKRYKAKQVLQHPWVISGGGRLKESLPNLQREVSMNLEKNFEGRKSGKRKGVGGAR